MIRQAEQIFKALADGSRLKVLMALEDGEMCVCQITALLGFAQSTVSRHMQVLQHAGLVMSEKRGMWVFYRLPGSEAPREIKNTLKLFRETWCHGGEYQQLKEQVKRIKSMKREELCKK